MSKREPSAGKKRNKERLIWLWIIASIGVIAMWAALPFVMRNVYPYSIDPGMFGDQFGSLNALFSGLAFIALTITVLLQKEELEATREEMRQQRIVSQDSARSLELANQVGALNAILSADLELQDYHRGILDRQYRIKGDIEAERRGIPTRPGEETAHRNSEYSNADNEARRQIDLLKPINSRINKNRKKLEAVLIDLQAKPTS